MTTLWLCCSLGIPLWFLINAHSYGVPQLCAVMHWVAPKTYANSYLLSVHLNCLFTCWHTTLSMRITQKGKNVNECWPFQRNEYLFTILLFWWTAMNSSMGHLCILSHFNVLTIYTNEYTSGFYRLVSEGLYNRKSILS